MNNTTTYKRSMFGLSEINADTINANNLVLSGPLQVNTITSTAAGQSLSIDALGTGTLSLKSGGVTKMSASNTATDFYSNVSIGSGKTFSIPNFSNVETTLTNINTKLTAISYDTSTGVNYTNLNSYLGIRAGNYLAFFDTGNNLKGYQQARSAGQVYGSNPNVPHLFEINGASKFTISTTSITSTIYIIAPTETVGSNNTRLATTAFVTTATLGLTGITYSDVGSIDMTTITNNVTIGAGKIFSIPNHSNVESELTYINDTLTGITYDVSSAATNFALQVIMNDILSIPSYADVKTTLDNLSVAAAGVLGISYSNVGGIDMTTIANNVTISATKKLSIPSYPDVESTLTSLSASLAVTTGITYDNTGGIDMTTIDNNLTIGTGKILSIPSFSNVETTLTTLTTNATGITYSAPYPLFIPQTTIAHDLYLATNKRLICDESWTKLYTTHDLTDSVGVGYFKGFMYNNGSIFTLSAVNPINVYDGTSTQINLKFSTREIEFGIGGMSLNWGSITLCTDIQLPIYPSLTGTLNQLSAYSDDFTDQLNNNNPIRWVSNSTLTYPDDEIGHRGIVRLPASDRYLYPVSSTNIFFWQDFKRIDFVFRITFSDTNMFYDIGLSDNNVGTNKSITWRYQNATSPNGWTPRVNGGLLTGWVSAATITTATTNWFYGSFTHYDSPTKKYIKFYIKNLTNLTEYSNTGAIETSIDATAEYRPYFRATSTGGGTKYLDIDYVSIEYRNDRPNPQPQYV